MSREPLAVVDLPPLPALQRPLLPLLWFDRIDLDLANELLIRWGHKMGPLERPEFAAHLPHALVHESEPVAVTIAATLVRHTIEGLPSDRYNRTNTLELARLCACRPGLCRIALRMWREFVFQPMRAIGWDHALSSQDADLHTGDTYRFDGWQRAAYAPSHGTDQRSGRVGRNKFHWIWPPDPSLPPLRGNGRWGG